MSSGFLADNNSCGQAWLQLVSRGNAIIAELLRLKDYIPPVFKLDNKADQLKYGKLILDFSYFKNPDINNKAIESNEDLAELDAELKENHIDLLERFYAAFESIQRFATDINNNVQDVQEGVYIQQTLETVFIDEDGRQLMCEALYLFGVMMLVVDLHVPGEIRERILVSYYRYSAQKSSSGSNIDDVCKLLRSTGLTNNSKRPTNYPENYFQRMQLNSEYVEMVIGRLRSDDIYNQIAAYPNPEQRTTALASQAAMLYVCLFFSPTILHSQYATMRSIVDNYFPNNWVINVYMGLTVNLIDSWEPFRAAKQALANTLDSINIKQQASFHSTKLIKLTHDTQDYLKEGILVKDNILDLVNKLTTLLRESNVTLRWLMLHTASNHSVSEIGKKCKQIRDQVLQEIKSPLLSIYKLLLNTAELELKVKDLLKVLLTEKGDKWNSLKEESESRVCELIEIFSGQTPLFRVIKNENLQKWFQTIKSTINGLTMDEPTVSAGKIVQLIEALEEVANFHQLKENLQVYQFLSDVRNNLQKMVQGVNVKEEVLINLQIVGDLSYAWELIDSYTDLMQTGIQSDPSMVIKLRATFLKLSSAMEIPLLRINQAQSQDFVSVSQYYSNELVSYVRKVLQIIPEKMFSIMSRIVHLQTSVIAEVPMRLDKDKLKDYAQLDHRMEVAKLTHQVSVLTEGVLKMKSTLVGIVEIDPKQLLEDGIRKELVRNIALALHQGLVFNQKKGNELPQKLKELGTIMDGYRRSFEYIQDYIGIHGLKIWQEELARVIGFNIDIESNTLKRSKILPWESIYQSKHIPIPLFSSLDNQSETCMGRLLRELIRITEATETTYNTGSTSWYEKKTKEMRVCADMNLFTKIASAVGVSGLIGLDKLICFMITSEIQFFLGLVNQTWKTQAWKEFFTSVMREMPQPHINLDNPSKVYGKWIASSVKLVPVVLDRVLKIGQLQLLRRHIYLELRTSSKFESKNLHNALINMNRVLINEVKIQQANPKPDSKEDTNLLAEVSSYLEWSGISNPLGKIFVTTCNIQYFSLFTFIFVIAQLPKLKTNKAGGWLSTSQIDGWVLVIGVQTLFRQVHPEVQSQFIIYMAQYANSYLQAFTSSKQIEKDKTLPLEVTVCLHFLLQFCELSGLPRSVLTKHIPTVVLDLFTLFISDTGS